MIKPGLCAVEKDLFPNHKGILSLIELNRNYFQVPISSLVFSILVCPWNLLSGACKVSAIPKDNEGQCFLPISEGNIPMRSFLPDYFIHEWLYQEQMQPSPGKVLHSYLYFPCLESYTTPPLLMHWLSHVWRRWQDDIQTSLSTGNPQLYVVGSGLKDRWHGKTHSRKSVRLLISINAFMCK